MGTKECQRVPECVRVPKRIRRVLKDAKQYQGVPRSAKEYQKCGKKCHMNIQECKMNARVPRNVKEYPRVPMHAKVPKEQKSMRVPEVSWNAKECLRVPKST